jgi:hypothetical protein
LLQWCYSVLSVSSPARSVAVCCAAGTLPGRLQGRGAHHAHATGSVPAALALPGADSLRFGHRFRSLRYRLVLQTKSANRL